MSLRIAVVHEADADFDMSTHLADRILIDSIDWLDEDLLTHQREWVGTNNELAKLTWKSIPRLAKEKGIKAHGHIGGEPLEADAGAARRAIRYLKAAFDELDAILLIRDQDDQPERRDGLEQARNKDHGDLVVVIGLAIIERESWVLAGFHPQDVIEQELLDAEWKLLGFHACESSYKLTAGKEDTAKLSPKRVLKVLCAGNVHRERLCWMQTPLAILRERGTGNGLSQFLDEIRSRLAPLFGHIKP